MKRFLYQFWLGILVSVLMGFSTNAAEKTDTVVVTLEKAQELALRHNPQLQIAEKNIRKAAAQADQVRGNLLPQMSLYTNYSHSFELPVITIEFPNPLTGQTEKTELAMGTKENITGGMRLQQPLFMGGALFSGWKIAEESAEMSQAQAEGTRQQTLLQVRQAVYGVLYSRELITVSQEALQNARRNLEQVRNQNEVGTASGFDLLRAQVQVSNVAPQVISARNRHVQALTGLKTAIGLPPETRLKVAGSLQMQHTTMLDSSLSELKERALQRRPEMKNIRHQRAIQNQNLKIARAKFLPTLSMTANIQHQYQEDEFDLNRQDFVRSISGGLTFSVPLFAGGSNYAGYQKAKVDRKTVEENARLVKNMITAEVETAYHSLEDAREKIESQNKTIEQATESLRLAELMYKEGTATQLEVLNAQLALQQAQSNYSQYLLQYNIAVDQLRKAMHKLQFRY